ncbi:hypothetical protein COOONC_09339 [Cooperia oncophora]
MKSSGDPLNMTVVSGLFDATVVDAPSKGNPPEPIFSDYLEMTSLVLMFIIGAPLNLAAYTQLAERPMTSRLDLLKRHLNYTDLLVIFIYVPSRACWLLTYDWRGGDLLCRVVKMMHTVAFQVRLLPHYLLPLNSRHSFLSIIAFAQCSLIDYSREITRNSEN